MANTTQRPHSFDHSTADQPDPDIFSDSHALDEPTGHIRGDDASTIRADSSASRTLRTGPALGQQRTDSQRMSMRRSIASQRSNVRSSIVSPVGDDFALRPFHRTGSELERVPSTAAHSIRSVSTITIPRAQSPYQGATGPSQPYGMYHQDVSLSRTASVATSSTARRPERLYSGPGGPSQPYGLYSQNTLPEDNPTTEVDITLQGPSDEYRRRQGPDGDDADDLIGPDGYTEQLPPYTRYPNGIPPKGEYPADSSTDTPPYMQQRASLLGPNRRREPVEQEAAPISQSPILTNPFDDSQQLTPPSTDAGSDKEASSFKERVKKKSTRKVCWGLMPCWLVIALVITLCLAVLLGGVIGGAVAHHSNVKPPKPTDTYVPAAA